MITFRKHLLWALVFGGAAGAVVRARPPPHLDARLVGRVAGRVPAAGRHLARRAVHAAAAQTEISKRPEQTRLSSSASGAGEGRSRRARRQQPRFARVDRKADPARAESRAGQPCCREEAKPASRPSRGARPRDASPEPARRDHLKPVPDLAAEQPTAGRPTSSGARRTRSCGSTAARRSRASIASAPSSGWPPSMRPARAARAAQAPRGRPLRSASTRAPPRRAA